MTPLLAVLLVSLLLFACWYLIRQFFAGLGDLPDDWPHTDGRR